MVPAVTRRTATHGHEDEIELETLLSQNLSDPERNNESSPNENGDQQHQHHHQHHRHHRQRRRCRRTFKLESNDDSSSFDHLWAFEMALTAFLLVVVPSLIEVGAQVVFPPTRADSSPVFETLRQTQIQSGRNGTGLMINIHLTHHAGTTLCERLGRAVGAPGHFCNHPDPTTDHHIPENYPKQKPWRGVAQTALNLQLVRQAYRYVSWEFGKVPRPTLNVTDWEHPKLVSILVVRDPIARALAGDWHTSEYHPFVIAYSKQYPNGGNNRTVEEWWKFAKDEYYDNFALRRLVGWGWGGGGPWTTPMTEQHLDYAKQLVSRFTLVLDQACLTENLHALSETLQIPLRIKDRNRRLSSHGGIKRNDTISALHASRNLHANPHHLKNADRIPFPEVYEYLLKAFQYDIELYQWAKRRSLAQCLDRGAS